MAEWQRFRDLILSCFGSVCCFSILESSGSALAGEILDQLGSGEVRRLAVSLYVMCQKEVFWHQCV